MEKYKWKFSIGAKIWLIFRIIVNVFAALLALIASVPLALLCLAAVASDVGLLILKLRIMFYLGIAISLIACYINVFYYSNYSSLLTVWIDPLITYALIRKNWDEML